MALPAPELGLVVHYGFVWAGDGRPSPPDGGKDRPCLIIDVREVEDVPGRTTRRVTYLPISHVAPRPGEAARAIAPRLAHYLGLTSEKSWLYTSYACEDDWPMDVAKRPGSDRFDYGFISPVLFDGIMGDFRADLRKRNDFVHQRS